MNDFDKVLARINSLGTAATHAAGDFAPANLASKVLGRLSIFKNNEAGGDQTWTIEVPAGVVGATDMIDLVMVGYTGQSCYFELSEGGISDSHAPASFSTNDSDQLSANCRFFSAPAAYGAQVVYFACVTLPAATGIFGGSTDGHNLGSALTLRLHVVWPALTADDWVILNVIAIHYPTGGLPS